MNLPLAFSTFQPSIHPEQNKNLPAGPFFSGHGRDAFAHAFRKSNPFDKSVRQDLYAYLMSKEFQPLQQVVTVLIVNATQKVIFEPVFAACRFAKEWSGLSAIGKKVKKWSEAKGKERAKRILPQIKLEPEKPEPGSKSS
jgi:hypothetical protein